MMKKMIALSVLLAIGSTAQAQLEKQQISTPRAGSGINVVLTPTNLLQDPSFEGGSPNAAWNETSTVFGTPLCDAGCGGGAPRTGLWWSWFGGTTDTTEVATLDQTVTIPAGTATLDFWLFATTAVAAGPDPLTVEIDGNNIATIAEDDPCCTAAYAQVSFDVSAFADGGNHNVFFGLSESDGTITNMFVDDVSLVVSGGPLPPPPTQVPALGAMGLGLLLLALGVVGMVNLRKSKVTA